MFRQREADKAKAAKAAREEMAALRSALRNGTPPHVGTCEGQHGTKGDAGFVFEELLLAGCRMQHECATEEDFEVRMLCSLLPHMCQVARLVFERNERNNHRDLVPYVLREDNSWTFTPDDVLG